jgi:hypothetical protein
VSQDRTFFTENALRFYFSQCSTATSKESSSAFSTERGSSQMKFIGDLQHSPAKIDTPNGASNGGVRSLYADAKTSKTIIGQEGRRSTIWTLKYLHAWRANRFSHPTHLLRPWGFASNSVEPPTQLAGDEKFSCSVGPTPVDERVAGHKAGKML